MAATKQLSGFHSPTPTPDRRGGAAHPAGDKHPLVVLLDLDEALHFAVRRRLTIRGRCGNFIVQSSPVRAEPVSHDSQKPYRSGWRVRYSSRRRREIRVANAIATHKSN
jgi:hypothetical protein